MAAHLAVGVKEDVGEEQVGQQVDRVFKLVLGRAAEKDEREPAIRLVQQHGLALLARTLFNTNEFLVIP